MQNTSDLWGKGPTCILRETACSWPLRLYIFVTACLLRIKDLAITLTASCSKRGRITIFVCKPWQDSVKWHSSRQTATCFPPSQLPPLC